MAIEDPLRRAVACCSKILLRYDDGERTTADKALMVAEIELVVGWLMELDLPAGATERGLFVPLEAHLLDARGPADGPRLNAEFVEAFGRSGMALVAPMMIKLDEKTYRLATPNFLQNSFA